MRSGPLPPAGSYSEVPKAASIRVTRMNPERRSSALSSLWIIVYLGSSAPIIAVSALVQPYGLLPAVSGFAALAVARKPEPTA
ncbi:hypothetical protein [Streptomyces sp. FH025]|uniref:hypothetical protein n=1 Tax=Streptomyces sp. FH025 TaxID=2815937 RepID=UPI001A9EBF8A|nr:hypothetical protein [Streptomyces sp. FH025]MBO1418572.1 hypothetical protein [Streptomyces sp. FH025]